MPNSLPPPTPPQKTNPQNPTLAPSGAGASTLPTSKPGVPELIVKSANSEDKPTHIPSGPMSKPPSATSTPSSAQAPAPAKPTDPIKTTPLPPPPPTMPVPTPPAGPRPITPVPLSATNTTAAVAKPSLPQSLAQSIPGSAKLVPFPSNLPPHRPMPGEVKPGSPPKPAPLPVGAPVPTAPTAPVKPVQTSVAMPAPLLQRPQPAPITSQLAGAGTPPKGGAPTPGQPGAQPAIAKQSILRFLPFIIGGLALLGVVLFILLKVLGLGNGGGTPATTGSNNPGTTVVAGQQTTLTYWGLWEPDALMQGVFKDFETANPDIKISYVMQKETDYRERLQTAIAEGNGPDLFRFHASWTPMLVNELANVPSTVFTPASFQSTFYPVASDQLISNGQIKGIPLMYDGLGLYYNIDILKSADAQPPTTWADLRILASQLTVTSNGKVERAGLAIGNSTNVEHFSDILALLMLQNGADLSNPTSPEAKEALIFYTDFLKQYHVWSEDLPSSTVAFARGDVAMMFAPSWRAHEILAQNPNLHFAIAPVPKLGTSTVSWASYWAEGVNSKSKNQAAAWKLLAYLSQPDVMKKMYSDQSGVRRFGELYSRKDLANDLSSQPLAQPFLSDAPTAKGGYMSSFTHDGGLNDQIIKYYQDAVTAVLNGTDADTALVTVGQGVSQVLRQYGVPVVAPAAPATNTTPTSL